jgi:hypothetical protein
LEDSKSNWKKRQYNALLCAQWKALIESLFDPPRRRSEPFTRMKRSEQKEYNKAYWIANKEKLEAKRRQQRGTTRRTPSDPKKAKELKKKKNREWYARNREIVLEKLRCKDKKDKIRKYQRERQKDPLRILENRCRSRLNIALKNQGFKKNTKTQQAIGCSWDQLKLHIEKQFTKGMNWSNRNLWHIDHIVPLSSATTPDQMTKLSHFSNLRPLWATDNYQKSAKIITCQPELLLIHE